MDGKAKLMSPEAIFEIFNFCFYFSPVSRISEEEELPQPKIEIGKRKLRKLFSPGGKTIRKVILRKTQKRKQRTKKRRLKSKHLVENFAFF